MTNSRTEHLGDLEPTFIFTFLEAIKKLTLAVPAVWVYILRLEV
jgi:hypothetical protein